MGLLTLLAVAAVASLSHPTTSYDTKAHVMLQPSWTTGEDAVAESNLVGQYMRTYVALGTSDTITQDVSKAVNDKYTPEQIADMMQVYWGGGSLLLAVQVSAPNLDDSLAIAQAGAKALVAHQADLLKLPAGKAPRLAVVQDAFETGTEEPTSLVARLTKGLTRGLAAGVVTSLLTAILLEVLASRRRRSAAPAGGAPDNRV